MAIAMANCIGKESMTTGKMCDVQNTQAITFDGVAKTAAQVIGKQSSANIVHFDPKDFHFPKGKEAFPMRPHHSFANIYQAINDLEWKPVFDLTEAILKDAYENNCVTSRLPAASRETLNADMILENAKKAGSWRE
jgi:hypothetical protein